MRFLVSLFLLVLICFGPAHAQQSQGDIYFHVRPHYNAKVADLFDSDPRTFKYTDLKVYYTQMPQYDPVGEDTRELMLNLAYLVMEENDQGALINYQRLLRAHIVNLAAVNLAISLAEQDPRFGNVAFLSAIRDGIFRNVLVSGDGMSLRGAYDAITFEEEVMLLQHLGVELIETKAHQKGLTYYNTHAVIEPNTGAAYTLFVDVSRPMRHLRLEAEDDVAPPDF